MAILKLAANDQTHEVKAGLNIGKPGHIQYDLTMSLVRHSYNHFNGRNKKDRNTFFPHWVGDEVINNAMVELGQLVEHKLENGGPEAAKTRYKLSSKLEFEVYEIWGEKAQCFPTINMPRVIGIDDKGFAALSSFALVDRAFNKNSFDLLNFHKQCYNDSSFKNQHKALYDDLRQARAKLKEALAESDNNSLQGKFVEACGNEVRVEQFFALTGENYD